MIIRTHINQTGRLIRSQSRWLPLQDSLKYGPNRDSGHTKQRKSLQIHSAAPLRCAPSRETGSKPVSSPSLDSSPSFSPSASLHSNVHCASQDALGCIRRADRAGSHVRRSERPPPLQFGAEAPAAISVRSECIERGCRGRQPRHLQCLVLNTLHRPTAPKSPSRLVWHALPDTRRSLLVVEVVRV